MEDSLYPKTNLKILSQRFRDIRTHNDYSLRGISRSENIAHTVISNIENGKIFPNVETLKSLYARVNVNLLIDEEVLKDYKEILGTIKEGVYYLENDMVIDLYKKIRKDTSILLHSLLYVDFLLVCALYDIVIDEHNESEHLDKLASFYMSFSDAQKVEYNLLKGMASFRKYSFKEAAMYYERNLALKGKKKSLAMTYSHLSRLYKQTYHTYNTIEYGKIASRLHSEEANLYEKLRSDVIVANELIDIDRFTEAYHVLENISITVDQKTGKLDVIHSSLHFLWSYWYFRKGDYKEAYNCLIEKPSNEPSYHLYQANILEEMHHIDEAVEVLIKAENDKYVLDDPLYQHLIPLYRYHLQKAYDNEDFEKQLLATIDKEYLIKDYAIYKQIFEMGLSYYAFHDKKDDALALMNSFLHRETLK